MILKSTGCLLESAVRAVWVWWIWAGFPNEVTVTLCVCEYVSSEYVLGLIFMAQNQNFNVRRLREIRSNYFIERKIIWWLLKSNTRSRIWFLSFWLWPLLKLEAKGGHKMSQTIHIPQWIDSLKMNFPCNKICILN